MKSILDKTFNYTPAAQTDLRKTFARVRKVIEKERQEVLKGLENCNAQLNEIDAVERASAPIKLAERRKS